MHFSSLRSLSFPHIHRRKNSEDAKSKGKGKPEPESEATELFSPDPFTHHTHLPPTSIANLVMDPDNLTALYRASAHEQAAHTPSSSSPSGSPNLDGAPSTLPHNTVAESVPESKNLEEINVVESHSNLSTPLTPHHPVQSIADIVLNPATLTALYETRDNDGSKGSELSGPV